MSRLLDIRNFVADKLKWQLQVIIDADLSANARLVGCLITHDLNVERGVAWRSQENMALALGVHKTTVRRGVAELAKAGYLAVRKAEGRGRSLNYQALIRDVDKAHESVDRAIQSRRNATCETPSKDAPALLSDLEKVAPVLLIDAEKVALGLRQVTPGATLTLEESFIPPSPPRQWERGNGVSRAYQVRRGRLEAAGNKLSFQDHDVREAARKRLGEEGVRSWLDPNAWDPPARTIVCQLNFTADRLTRELSGDLKALGVKVVCDKRRFAELMQTGRPIVSELFERAT